MPVEKVGCCSFVWIHWMTQPMIRAYKHCLNTRDLFEMPNQDQVIVDAMPLWLVWDLYKCFAVSELDLGWLGCIRGLSSEVGPSRC